MTQIEKLDAMTAEYTRGIEFHLSSFNDIEAKAKYWATFTLSAIGVASSYFFSNFDSLSVPEKTLIPSVIATLLIATVYFWASMRVQKVSSGVVVPTDFKQESLAFYLKGGKWEKYAEKKCAQRLKALELNTKTNTIKSGNLKKGEATLFFAAILSFPFSVLFSSFFLYNIISQVWLPIIGVLVGVLSSIIATKNISSQS